jgi:hypothetical protein
VEMRLQTLRPQKRKRVRCLIHQSIPSMRFGPFLSSSLRGARAQRHEWLWVERADSLGFWGLL